nr:transposase [Abyssibacter sp.]
MAELYRRRWDVELNFRDLKSTLGMDVLRGLTPATVRKEILMHLIVYNAIRLLMLEAADQHKASLRRVSFKASMQALRHWEPQISQAGLSHTDRRALLRLMHASIAQACVPDRPGRREPRCVKRRPKPYALLTTRRDQMQEVPHRGRYRAKTA